MTFFLLAIFYILFTLLAIFMVFVFYYTYRVKTTPISIEQICAHEAGHALLLYGFQPFFLINSIALVSKTGGSCTFSLNRQLQEEISNHPNYQMLTMLIDLGGYLGEKQLLGKHVFFFSRKSQDMQQWRDKYYHLQGLQDEKRPKFKFFEFLKMYKFKKQQIALIRTYLGLNQAVLAQLYQQLLTDKILTHASLAPFISDIKYPANFPTVRLG